MPSGCRSASDGPDQAGIKRRSDRDQDRLLSTHTGVTTAIMASMDDTRALAAELALRLAGAHDRDVDDLIVDALRLVAVRAGAARSYVTVFHADGSFENSHEWTADGVVPHRPVIRELRSADFAYSYEKARRGEVLAVPRLDQLPDDGVAERRSFSSFGVSAVLQVPIHVSDAFVGLVGINHFEPVEPWTEEYVDLVRRVGEAIGVTLVRQRAVAAAEHAAHEAARAQRQRQELIGQVSHELLTPLHAVLGYAELLELDHRSAADQEALLQIQVHGRHLLTLIEGLLILSERDGSAEPIDLTAAIDEAIDGLASVARSRNVRLERRAAGETIATADGVRCRQVLYCLLTGAIDALGNGGTVEVEPGARGDSAVVRVHATSDAGLADREVVTPFTRALLEGHGRIVEQASGDDRVEVVVELDQLASP